MTKTDDLKKGTRVLLRSGFEAVLADNKKGNIRVAEVYGDFTETGSVYAHDIVAFERKGLKPTTVDPKDQTWNGYWDRDILYTEAQLDLREKVRGLV